MEIVSNIWDILSGICVTLIVLFYKGLWKIVSQFSVAQNDIIHLKESQKDIKQELNSIRPYVYSSTLVKKER